MHENSTSPRWLQRASTIYAACARFAVALERRSPPGYSSSSIVIPRLDSCNSLLAGEYNRTATTRSKRRCSTDIRVRQCTSHTKPIQLHWLPIRWRVQFKVCCMLMHAVVTGSCPAYLRSIVQPATQSRSGLRPSSFDFSVLRTRTKFSERGFSYAGPAVWNELPRHIRETVDSDSFRKLLKTHYFTSAFGESNN